MKINAAVKQQEILPKKSKSQIEKEDTRKKLAEKFGKKFETKSEKKEAASVELSNSAKQQAHIDPDGFGDIKDNDPTKESTQNKLKHLLKSGAMIFSDKERAALGEILK